VEQYELNVARYLLLSYMPFKTTYQKMHPKQRKELHEALSKVRDDHQSDLNHPRMNIAQFLAGKVNAQTGAIEHAFLSFPTTYWELQTFLLIPIVLCVAVGSKPLLSNSTPEVRVKAKQVLIMLVVIALLQAAVWDNYGASLGIWVFDQRNMFLDSNVMLGLPVPGEEYLWILNDTLFSYAFTLRLWTEFGAGRPPAAVSPVARKVGFIVLISSALIGVAFLAFLPSTYAFLGISLAFFCPFIAWQWAQSSAVFLGYWKVWLASWLVPGLWTYLADCIAVNQGIWVFDYDKFTSGIWIGGLVQPEVLLTCVIACVVCSQTAMAAVGACCLDENKPRNGHCD